MNFSDLPLEVLWAIGGIFTLLGLSSLIIYFLKLQNPEGTTNELVARIRTWWVIAIIFVLMLVGNHGFAVILLAFVSFLTLKEYLSLIPTRRADRRVIFWAYLAIPIQYYWVYIEWYPMFIVFIPVYMFLLLPTRAILTGRTEGFVKAMGTLHWGLMTTVFSLSHPAFLLCFQTGESPHATPHWFSEQATSHPGPGLLLTLVLLTELNDVAQFIWGKSFGKRRVAPLISPGKTVEGFVGGVITTALVATAVGPVLTMMDWQHSLFVGLVIGVAGFLGDLSISAVKRDLGVKDSGSLLPGHGGILDRLDSLTYTAPLYFHITYYFYG